MKTKMILFTMSALFFLAGEIGCEKKSEDLTKEATIKYLPPEDNCGSFMVVVGTPEEITSLWYKPDNLPDKFKIDNLKVQITYTVTDRKHSCGFGGYKPIIIIQTIKEK